MRGQAEFAIIIGLVVVVAVVAVVAYQSFTAVPPVPVEVAAEQRLVEDYVLNVIRSGTDEIVEFMEGSGGYMPTYLIPSGEEYFIPLYANFEGRGVALWSLCNYTGAPGNTDVKAILETALGLYLKKNLNESMVVEGKQVEFDLEKVEVRVNVLDNKIEPIVVNLPTSIAGYSIAKPYTTAYPTMLGRLVKFGNDFAAESANERFLETYAISSVLESSGLPTTGLLTECGEIKIVTPDDIAEGIERSIARSIMNLAFWERVSPEEGTYPVYALNGNQYPDIDFSIWLSDDFGLKYLEPIILVNNGIIYSTSIITTPFCIRAYYQKYGYSYPIIVSAKDPLTGYDFNFAVYVYVDDDLPGDCAVLQQHRCLSTECSTSLKVVDTSGNPIEGARASFNLCDIGSSDENGMVEGPIECSAGDLAITAEGYSPLTEEGINYHAVDRTWTLVRQTELTLRFYELGVDCSSRPVDFEDVLITFIDEDGKRSSVSNIDFSESGDCVEPAECETCDRLMSQAGEDCKQTEACLRFSAPGGESYEDACSQDCVNAVAEIKNLDVCIDCDAARLECYSTGNIPNVTITADPGEYMIESIAINKNPAFDGYRQAGNSFIEIPAIDNVTKSATILESDGTEQIANVYVQETDGLIGTALYVFNSWYSACHGNCMQATEDGYICMTEDDLAKKYKLPSASLTNCYSASLLPLAGVWTPCDTECAEGIAISEAIKVIMGYNFELLVTVCQNLGLIEGGLEYV